jgi:hypothetical protein
VGGAFEPRGIIGSSEIAGGRYNPINPSGRQDNCTACTTAGILNGLSGSDMWTADLVEAHFGYTGASRAFTEFQSLGYIENATGLRGTRAAFMDADALVGYYAVFPRANYSGVAEHVIYGQVFPNGQRYLFDAQEGTRQTWQEMLKQYNAARAYYLK